MTVVDETRSMRDGKIDDDEDDDDDRDGEDANGEE